VTPLIINPLAEADLIDGRVWCDRYRQGTGIDFLLYVEDTFEQLRQNPKAFGCEYEDIRVAPVRPFLFAVAYRVDENQITVLAVYHLNSDPRKWQNRLES